MVRNSPNNGAAAGHAFFLPDSVVGLAVALAAAAVFWAATPDWPDTPDGLIHLQRVRSLADALRLGLPYPRWFPDFAFGYGHPILHYYAPAFYYPPALLHLLGLELLPAVRLTLAAVFGFSGWAFAALLRRLVPLPAVLAGTVVFLAFPYRFYDFIIRGALPEFAAFLWLPLLGLGLVQCLQCNLDAVVPWQRRATQIAPIALATALLILTHNLTALMAAPAALAAALLLLWRRDRALLRAGLLAAGVVVGGLLSAPYAIPALCEAAWVGIGSAPLAHGYANHFADWRRLFQPTLIYQYPAAADLTVPLPGFVLLFIAAATAAFFGTPTARLRRLLGTALMLAILALWLSSTASAWVWQVSAPVLGKLQFPWRWQSIETLAVGLLVAGSVAALEERRGPRWSVPAGVAASLLALLATFGSLAYPSTPITDQELTVEQMWSRDVELGQIGATWTGEFLPRWVTEERWAIGRAPTKVAPAAPAANVSMRPVTAGYLTRIYTSSSPRPVTVRLPRFFFPAWRVTVDDEDVTTYPVDSLGLLAFDLPAGDHRVLLRWRATPAVRVGQGAALCGWLVLLWALGGRRQRTAALLWALVGVVSLAAAAGWTATSAPLIPLQADFGPVRLEAAQLSLPDGSAQAKITLFWSVQSRAELTSFVHLVDEHGQIVGQADGPLAGPYLPAARWQPGLLIEHTERIALPVDRGAYTVLAGVYPTGRPAAPLRPAGAANERVLIGQMEMGP